MDAELKPCPFCADPMMVRGDHIQHVTQTPSCPMRDLSLPVERIADWNARPQPELEWLGCNAVAPMPEAERVTTAKAERTAEIVAWLRASAYYPICIGLATAIEERFPHAK